MNQGVIHSSHTSGRHSAARHYGEADGDAPHACEFCAPEPQLIAAGSGGAVAADVRRWQSASPEPAEEAWIPES